MAKKTNKSISKGKSGLSEKVARKTAKSSSKESAIEATASLVRIAHRSSAQAVRESKALGLSITYMEKGILYKEDAEGNKVAIKSLVKKTAKRKVGSIIIKKGLVIHAKK